MIQKHSHINIWPNQDETKSNMQLAKNKKCATFQQCCLMIIIILDERIIVELLNIILNMIKIWRSLLKHDKKTAELLQIQYILTNDTWIMPGYKAIEQ